MEMTSFELLKDLDITSVAISHICFKNELFFHHQRKCATLFGFMPCCSTFQMVRHREGILILPECLITNLNLMNGMK